MDLHAPPAHHFLLADLRDLARLGLVPACHRGLSPSAGHRPRPHQAGIRVG
jgi:hypothetical protein